MKFADSGNEAIAKTEILDVPNPQDYIDYVQNKKMQESTAKKSDFIFADEKMLRIKELVEQISHTDVPVLITGESGTGKEVIARMIHKTCNRNDKPFVAINCAAMPANLLESELFGFERGAFTGATQRHIGKFEQANKGTLLLDEITETDKSLQAKLLRALQEREIERLGGDGPISIDARVIATTNRDINCAVSEGKFREDLFYRLYVLHIEVPPLRQRPKDIEVLTRHFVKTFGKQYRDRQFSISADAMTKLTKFNWPGNVRQLQNIVQRAIIMAKSDIVTADLFNFETSKPAFENDWVKYLPIGKKMRVVETQFIIETLKHHNGNRTHAAKTLGISLRTLRNKINEFTHEGFEIPEPVIGKAV
ncbi:MAG: sigma-54 interaction domain-containing protein [Oligoflexales bacterium]